MNADMESVPSPAESMQRALAAAGTQVVLGQVIGLSQPAISKRLKAKRPVTAEEAVAIERELGIPRHVSRPDLFSAEVALANDDGRAMIEANR